MPMIIISYVRFLWPHTELVITFICISVSPDSKVHMQMPSFNTRIGDMPGHSKTPQDQWALEDYLSTVGHCGLTGGGSGTAQSRSATNKTAIHALALNLRSSLEAKKKKEMSFRMCPSFLLLRTCTRKWFLPRQPTHGGYLYLFFLSDPRPLRIEGGDLIVVHITTCLSDCRSASYLVKQCSSAVPWGGGGASSEGTNQCLFFQVLLL